MLAPRSSKRRHNRRVSSIETILVRVHGRVQGIGYRDACVRQARAIGITGWVRNRMDDSVEALLQGSPDELDTMCEWMREGMPAALVETFERTEVAPPFARFDRFERVPTL
jgi:acylphosphatase